MKVTVIKDIRSAYGITDDKDNIIEEKPYIKHRKGKVMLLNSKQYKNLRNSCNSCIEGEHVIIDRTEPEVKNFYYPKKKGKQRNGL